MCQYAPRSQREQNHKQGSNVDCQSLLGGCDEEFVEPIVTYKEKGIQTLWLEVRESNPARFLYEKLGFNEVDIRKNYYPKPDGGRENAVVMACYL